MLNKTLNRLEILEGLTKALKELRNLLATTQTKFEKESRSIGLDLISISTNEDFVEPLLSLFKMREKRN